MFYFKIKILERERKKQVLRFRSVETNNRVVWIECGRPLPRTFLWASKLKTKYFPEHQIKKVGGGNKSVFYFCVIKPSIRTDVINKEAGKTKIWGIVRESIWCRGERK